MGAVKLQPLKIGKGELIQIEKYIEKPLQAKWLAHLLEHKSEWRPFNNFTGSYSYGQSWYIEVETGNLHRYHANAAKADKLISEIPQFIEQMVASSKFLMGPKNQMDLPTRARNQNLGPYWSGPGLHIIGGPKAPKWSGGDIHADYEGLSPYPEALFSEDTHAFSSIVTVSLPEKGGGLEVWDKRRFLANELDADKQCTPATCRKLEYSLGQLTIIDSFLFHRIEGCEFTKASPWRITAVIHFLYREKPYPHWEYWF